MTVATAATVKYRNNDAIRQGMPGHHRKDTTAAIEPANKLAPRSQAITPLRLVTPSTHP